MTGQGGARNNNQDPERLLLSVNVMGYRIQLNKVGAKCLALESWNTVTVPA